VRNKAHHPKVHAASTTLLPNTTRFTSARAEVIALTTSTWTDHTDCDDLIHMPRPRSSVRLERAGVPATPRAGRTRVYE